MNAIVLCFIREFQFYLQIFYRYFRILSLNFRNIFSLVFLNIARLLLLFQWTSSSSKNCQLYSFLCRLSEGVLVSEIMGLLTDPTNDENTKKTFIVKYHSKICLLMVFCSVTWLCFLAHDNFSAGMLYCIRMIRLLSSYR